MLKDFLNPMRFFNRLVLEEGNAWESLLRGWRTFYFLPTSSRPLSSPKRETRCLHWTLMLDSQMDLIHSKQELQFYKDACSLFISNKKNVVNFCLVVLAWFQCSPLVQEAHTLHHSASDLGVPGSVGFILETTRIEVSEASDSIQWSVLQTAAGPRQGMKCELQLWPLVEQGPDTGNIDQAGHSNSSSSGGGDSQQSQPGQYVTPSREML